MGHVILFSGGLDSFIAYHYIKEQYGINPTLLYVPIAHRYQERELRAISILTAKGVIPKVTHDFSLYLKDWEQPDASIPMRNSLLAHVAARYGEDIWMIVQKGETNIPDRSPDFFKLLTVTLSYLNDRAIRVDSPFWDMTKVDMVEWYRSKELDLEALRTTSSCYNPVTAYGRYIPCGECAACFRRWVAFELNGISEKYATSPWKSNLAKTYKEKGQAGFYGSGRDEEILGALKRKGAI